MRNALRTLSIVILFVSTTVKGRAQSYTFTIFAGQTNAVGTNNGVGTNALFNHPQSLAVDTNGTVFVADTGNNVIRQIDRSGNVTTMVPFAYETTLPVSPIDFFVEPLIEFIVFENPRAVALDAHNNLYVSDNSSLYRATNNPVDGTYSFDAFFSNVFSPSNAVGLAVDTGGNMYVADPNSNIVYKVDAAGNKTNLTTYDGSVGIAVDSLTNIFLTDSYGAITKLSPPDILSGYWGEVMPADIIGIDPNQFYFPFARAEGIDASGNIYVVSGNDGFSAAVIKINGVTDNDLPIFGYNQMLGHLPVIGTNPMAATISGIVVDSFNNIYLSDEVNSVIIKGTPNYPAFFNGAVNLSGGSSYLQFTNGTAFGVINLLKFPYVYHHDLGWEYFFDASDAQNGGDFYDFASGDFFYTNPQLFPYLYDFTLNAWLYYYPSGNPNYYSSNPRYFYNFGTGQIITR